MIRILEENTLKTEHPVYVMGMYRNMTTTVQSKFESSSIMYLELKELVNESQWK